MAVFEGGLPIALDMAELCAQGIDVVKYREPSGGQWHHCVLNGGQIEICAIEAVDDIETAMAASRLDQILAAAQEIARARAAGDSVQACPAFLYLAQQEALRKTVAWCGRDLP
jgi:hypothetical protein